MNNLRRFYPFQAQKMSEAQRAQQIQQVQQEQQRCISFNCEVI